MISPGSIPRVQIDRCCLASFLVAVCNQGGVMRRYYGVPIFVVANVVVGVSKVVEVFEEDMSGQKNSCLLSCEVKVTWSIKLLL